MGDSLRKVQTGQPLKIPAAAYNAFVDAAVDYQHRQRNAGGQGRQSTRQANMVLVRNDTGAAIGRFAVLGISGPVISPATSLDGFKNHVALAGVTPAAEHAGRFVVTAEPVAAGQIGQAFATGVCQVQVDMADATHRYADIAAAISTHLASSTTGAARILWSAGTTGVQWAVIAFGGSGGGSSVLRVEAQAAAAAQATLSVRELNADGTYAAAAFDAHNLDRANWDVTYPDVAIGDLLFAFQTGGEWYAVPAKTGGSGGGYAAIENIGYAQVTGVPGTSTTISAALWDGSAFAGAAITIETSNGVYWRDVFPEVKQNVTSFVVVKIAGVANWKAVPLEIRVPAC